MHHMTDLAALPDRAGLTTRAVEIVFRGADQGNAGDAADPVRFERSLPATDAAESSSLLAYAMNGEPLPLGQSEYLLSLTAQIYLSVRCGTRAASANGKGFFSPNDPPGGRGG